jgi:hypothetical protein
VLLIEIVGQFAERARIECAAGEAGEDLIDSGRGDFRLRAAMAFDFSFHEGDLRGGIVYAFSAATGSG